MGFKRGSRKAGEVLRNTSQLVSSLCPANYGEEFPLTNLSQVSEKRLFRSWLRGPRAARHDKTHGGRGHRFSTVTTSLSAT